MKTKKLAVAVLAVLLIMSMLSFFEFPYTPTVKPVRALTDTFGTTTIGYTDCDMDTDRIRGSPSAPEHDGNVTSLTFALKATSETSGNAKAALYFLNMSLVDTTEEQSVSYTTSYVWTQFNFTSPVAVVADTTYLVLVWLDYTAVNLWLAGENVNASANEEYYQNLAYGAWPDPGIFSEEQYTISGYATYDYEEESGPDTSPPLFSTATVNTTSPGAGVQISSTITDGSGVSAWGFAWNNSGSTVNASEIAVSGNSVSAKFNGTWNSTLNNVVWVQFWANDSLNNAGYSTIEYFTLNTTYIVWAASGSKTDLQAAINNVRANGTGTAPNKQGTVYIPAGEWQLDSGAIGGYTSFFSFDTTPYFVYSYGGINIIGQGIYSTNLTLNPNNATLDTSQMICVDGSNQLPVRISGISFFGRNGTATATGDTAVFIDSGKDFRVDHNSFEDLGSCGVATFGSVPALTTRGVVDHNYFYRMYKPDAETAGTGYGYGVGVERTYQKGSSMQSKLWNDYGTASQFFGSYGNVTYIEDNYFQGVRHAIVAYAVGAYVARYNTFTEMWVPYGSGFADVHGAYPDGTYGGRYTEVYNNTFLNPSGGNEYGSTDNAHATRHRGGAGLVYNNTVVDHVYAFGITADDGNTVYTVNKINQLYIWNNTLTNSSLLDLTENYNNRIENTHYFLRAPSYALDGWNYTAYPYPHPLVASGEPPPPETVTYTLSLTVNNPQNLNYNTTSIPVSLSTSGNETGVSIAYNVQFFNGSWLYGTNQTYTSITSMTITESVMATFCAEATGAHGTVDYKTVSFNVTLAADTYVLILNVYSPQNTTYERGSVPIAVALSTTGNETGATYNWNVLSNGAWLYGVNQTSSTGTLTFNENSTATFAVSAVGSHSASDYETVSFTVSIVISENALPSLSTNYLWQYLFAGDIVGFFTAMLTLSFGVLDLAIGVVAMLFLVPLYIRTKSLPLLCIIWIMLGGFLIVAMPVASGIAVLFMALGIGGGIIWRLFRPSHSY